MSIVAIIFILIVLGVLLYFVNHFDKIDGNVRTIINLVALLAIVYWLLKLFVPEVFGVRIG